MAWVKLDDGFYDNPKILAVGLAAAGLYAAALTYAARKLTDGFVPHVAVAMLTEDAELPKALVTHGLWTVVTGGYQIHDFLEYNPPASKVKADRQAAKERMQKMRSQNVRPNNSGRSGDVREMFATPVPVPVPEQNRKGRGWRSVPPSEELTPARITAAQTANRGFTSGRIRTEWVLYTSHEFQRPHWDVDATWRTWCVRADRFGRNGSRDSSSGRVVPGVEETQSLLRRITR